MSVGSRVDSRSRSGASVPRRVRSLFSRLQACGPRPTGEAIWLALRRLEEVDPEIYEQVVCQFEVIAAVPPEVHAWLGHRDWPPAPLTVVRNAA